MTPSGDADHIVEAVEGAARVPIPGLLSLRRLGPIAAQEEKARRSEQLSGDLREASRNFPCIAGKLKFAHPILHQGAATFLDERLLWDLMEDPETLKDILDDFMGNALDVYVGRHSGQGRHHLYG